MKIRGKRQLKDQPKSSNTQIQIPRKNKKKIGEEEIFKETRHHIRIPIQ